MYHVILYEAKPNREKGNEKKNVIKQGFRLHLNNEVENGK